MAAASLLALIDDITTVLDDIALLTKVAAHKTAGVLGDDLALNAQQVAGVHADRELPVVWAVAKGSLRNKAILVPAALAISAFAPWAVTPLLMVGGTYLGYEGFEKLAHWLTHALAQRHGPDRADQAHHAELMRALADPAVDLVALEQEKIRGAVRTDFILSAEIIAITLGTVADASLTTQVVVLSGVAVIMTAGVYGLVGAIVKLDDAGLILSARPGRGAHARLQRRIGAVLLHAAPALMKSLSVVGTAAMFLVGGGILVHGVPVARAAVDALAESIRVLPAFGPAFGAVIAALVPVLADLLTGIAAGALAWAGASLVRRLLPARSRT